MATDQRRTWLWEDLSSWSSIVMRQIAPEVNQDVLRRFSERPPRYVVGDDLTWLDDIIEASSGQVVDMKATLGVRLHRAFDSLRAYHGARPESVAAYLERGLVPLEPAAAQQRARQLFSDHTRGGFTSAQLDAAIAKVDTSTRAGRVYFEANRRFLEDHCAHYMLYGSEYITGIAAALSGWPPDVRQVLKTTGIPTVFICDVPLSMIHQETVEEFAGMAIQAIFERLLEPDLPHPGLGQGAGFSIRQELPAPCIVGYEQPRILFDPLLHRKVFC